MVRSGGCYYLTGTVENEDEVLVWSSPSLLELDLRPPTCVWRAECSGGASAQVWAPELHELEGLWWLYFTAGDGRDEAHRHFVLSAGAPLGPYTGLKLVDPSFDQYAIDGSVMKLGGVLYWLYATYDGIWVAPMVAPDRVGEHRLRIAVGDQPWEHAWTLVEGEWAQSGVHYWIEAPQALIHKGRTFVAYSAGHSATPHYAMGLLECVGDVMDPSSWIKTAGPVFAPSETGADSVWTVGHASFTNSPDGKEDWIVYHGKESVSGGLAGRTVRMQVFDWAADGAPYFGRPKPAAERQKPPSGEA